MLTNTDLLQTLEIAVSLHYEVPAAPQLSTAQPPEKQPQSQQSQELQQGAEESQELQERPREILVQEQLCSKLQVSFSVMFVL